MSEDLATAALLEFLNAAEAGIATAKRLISEGKGVTAVREETFNILKFEKQQGARIGEYEVAYQPNNIPDKFQSAFNILKKGNATISARYHGDGYVFGYWLYGEDKIYRQKRK